MKKENTDIVLFISDLGGGGAQRVVCKLADHWTKEGKTVAIITLTDPKNDFYCVPHKATRVTLGLYGQSHSLFGSLLKNIRRILRLRRVLIGLKPTVAIGFIGPTAALLVAATIRTKIYTIAAERNDPSVQTFGKIWDKLCVLAYRYADRITVNSTGAHRSLGPKFGFDKTIFTPNPTPSIVDGPKLNWDASIVLAVSRLHPQKGLDLLLRAFAALHAPEWHLFIVGEGKERARLEAIAEKLGIKSRTYFTGAVADPSIYFRSADIFALPSRHEGTPNALLEAMSNGLPTVVSDASSGPLDILHGTDAGLIMRTEDVSSLTKALQVLVDDRAYRQHLGKNALKAIDERRCTEKAYVLWDQAIDFPPEMTTG